LSRPGLEGVEVSRSIEAEDSRAISPYHPLPVDWNYGRDPIVVQARSGGGVVHADVALVEPRDPAQRACHEFVAGNTERINMVVHQAVKGVHTTGPVGVEKG